MADNRNINITISASDEASATINKAVDNMAKVHPEAVNLAAGLEIVTNAGELVAHAFEAVEAQLDRAFEEALAGEKAMNQLKGALVSSGQYTAEANTELQEYAESLEVAVGANGDLAKQLISTGLNMGLSIDKAKEMEQAARQLAAATGQDVTSAFSALQAAQAGNARALDKLIPGVKELTKGQLQQGDAINVVIKATKAQYDLYQGSLPAALDKSEQAIGNVYKAIGNMILQNPLALKAVSMFIDVMHELEDGIKAVDQWIRTNQGGIETFAKNLGLAVVVVGAFTIALNASAIAAAASAAATTGLATAIAFATGPIGLAIIAITAVTAALYKWPGLFDVIAGGFKFFAGMFLEGMAGILKATAAFVGFFDKDMGASITRAQNMIMGYADNLQQAGQKQADLGIQSIETGKAAETAGAQEVKASDAALVAANNHNAAIKALIKTYAGFSEGTDAARKAMESEVQTRDANKKEFEAYLNDKNRLAISKAEEQKFELDAIRAKALKGGGAAGAGASAQAEIDAERTKQAELKVLYDQDIINQEQYGQAKLASEQRQALQERALAQVNQQALLQTLGKTPEALQLQQQLDQQNFQLHLQDMVTQAQAEKATQDQIDSMQDQAKAQFYSDQQKLTESYVNSESTDGQKRAANWANDLATIQKAQAEHGKIMGALSGAANSSLVTGTGQALSTVANLRNTNSKKAFALGKGAAIGEATINTYKSATAAFSSLAGIPFIGPVLGAAAAAAAVASGLAQIQQIRHQEFQGGQADSGMDAVPQSLSGRSFVLSAGERVVQPTANQDLTSFLDSQKSGSGGGANYNITLHYNGSGSSADAKSMAQMVIKEIRSASERGQPIMSSKGLTS